MSRYQTYKIAFVGKQLPFAFVDMDLLNANIRDIILRAGQKKIRVASKSVRSVAILRHILAADPAKFQGIMCFTLQEAVYLSQQGFDDLLLGYPFWQAAPLKAVCREVQKGKTITLMVDSEQHVRRLENIAASCDIVQPVCIDLDLSSDFPGIHFGVWRSPIKTPEAALRLARLIQDSPHLRLEGLMGYEAQIAGLGDNAPGQKLKNKLVQYLKQRSITELTTRRAEVLKLLEANGMALRFVNGGGTGSLESTRLEGGVTEVTVGSGFFSPTLFDNYRTFRHLPAAGYAIEIVRQPKPNIYTCSGGGYIASGATGVDKQPRPYLPEGAKLLSLEGAGEVQTPVVYKGAETLEIGDPIFMRHSKAGELCEHFNTLLLVSRGEVVDEVSTYRGDGKCFL